LKKVKNLSKSADWVKARELKFCKNAFGYENFKASFSDFEISEVCGEFFCLQYVESLHAPYWRIRFFLIADGINDIFRSNLKQIVVQFEFIKNTVRIKVCFDQLFRKHKKQFSDLLGSVSKVTLNTFYRRFETGAKRLV
jgi:hypothetical protein